MAEAITRGIGISLGVLPGSEVMDRIILPGLREQLMRGLVLMEGSFPVG